MGAKQIPSRKHKKGKKPWEYPDYQGKQRRWGGKHFRQKKPVTVPWSWGVELEPEQKTTTTVEEYSDYVMYQYNYPPLNPVPEEGIQQTIEFNAFTVDLSEAELSVISQLSEQMAKSTAKALDEQLMKYFMESDDKEGNSSTN